MGTKDNKDFQANLMDYSAALDNLSDKFAFPYVFSR